MTTTYNMAEELYYTSCIAAMDEEDEYRKSDAGVIENYLDLYFNEGFPKCPTRCIRSHSKRLEKAYWSAYFDFERSTKGWWGFYAVGEAALLEKHYSPVVDETPEFGPQPVEDAPF